MGVTDALKSVKKPTAWESIPNTMSLVFATGSPCQGWLPSREPASVDKREGVKTDTYSYVCYAFEQ